MKKIKIFFGIAVLAAGILTFNSCSKDFEQINTNPNVPDATLAAPDMLLTNAIESMTDRVHEIFMGHEMGSCWAQHMAKCQYTDEDRYIPRLPVINNTWTSFYAANGMDIKTIYDIGVARKNDSYQGVALVLKSYISSVLTDLFGPIPYSAAWKGGEGPEGLQPAYDTQESVYRDIIAKLDEANTLLNTGTDISGDILFANDLAKWKMFANSMRLRLLLRMSGRDAAFATTEMSKMIADPGKYPLFGSNADNAALAYLGSAPNNHPINENRKTRDDHRVSKNFIDLLNTFGDYRLMVFALPDGKGTFDGMPNGLYSAAALAYNDGGLKNTSKIGDYFTAATAPGMLMSYAELQFILAEAAVKGFIPGGLAKAKDYYNAGVIGSFEQFRAPLQEIFDAHAGASYGGLGVPAAYTVDDEMNWHVGDSTAPAFFNVNTITANAALTLIRSQRYIATFDQGLQTWFEWRRTRTPVLTPALNGELGGQMPVRVTYPTDEYGRNLTNVTQGVSLLGGEDKLTTKVWWDLN